MLLIGSYEGFSVSKNVLDFVSKYKDAMHACASDGLYAVAHPCVDDFCALLVPILTLPLLQS